MAILSLDKSWRRAVSLGSGWDWESAAGLFLSSEDDFTLVRLLQFQTANEELLLQQKALAEQAYKDSKSEGKMELQNKTELKPDADNWIVKEWSENRIESEKRIKMENKSGEER